MQLENLLSMDQVQTITIVALFLVSTVGGGGLVAVNNEADENSEKVDTLAEATWDFVLAVEGMQTAFEEAFVEDSVRMDAIEEKDDRTAENISSLLSQISTAESQVSTLESQVSTLESEVSSLNHRLNTSGIQNNPPIIFTDAVDTDLSPQQGFDGDSDDPSTPNFVRIILSAIDLDGSVISFGVDTNMDGQIDQEFAHTNESTFGTPTYYTIWNLSAHDFDYHPTDWAGIGGNPGYDVCLARILVIAIDDQGASSYYPMQIPITAEDPGNDCSR